MQKGLFFFNLNSFIDVQRQNNLSTFLYLNHFASIPNYVKPQT